jgi:hypothetical protein
VLGVDTQVTGNRVANCRDYCLRDIGGSVQSTSNHFFGATTAVQFEGGPSRSRGDRFSDAAIGFNILSAAGGTHIADGTSEHCWDANIFADANRVRVHNTRILVSNTDTVNLGHNGLNIAGRQSIIGLVLGGNCTQAMVTDCDIEVGAHTFEGDEDLDGSTGVLLNADHVIISNLKIQGSNTDDEIGVRVLPDHFGGDFFIDARGGGFNETNDVVVKFEDPGMGQDPNQGQVWYIVYDADENEHPLEISSNWNASLRIFIRKTTEADWTEIPTGTAYPP